MARNFAGGTDQLNYTIPGDPVNEGTVAFWMKSSSGSVNTSVVSYWNSSSRNGWGVLMNVTAGKITAQAYSSVSTPRISIDSTTTVNDGNWHHVAFTYNRFGGGGCGIFIDGVPEVTANSSAQWLFLNSNLPLRLGQEPSFWADYVGDLAEVAHWTTRINGDEVAALGKGFSPNQIRPSLLQCYAPLVRSAAERRNGFALTEVGTTVVPHCRVIGGAI